MSSNEIRPKNISTEEKTEFGKLNDATDQHTRTGIEMTYEIRTMVFCEFENLSYPMDGQKRDITFGSSSSGGFFMLNEIHRK